MSQGPNLRIIRSKPGSLCGSSPCQIRKVSLVALHKSLERLINGNDVLEERNASPHLASFIGILNESLLRHNARCAALRTLEKSVIDIGAVNWGQSAGLTPDLFVA
ncbi:hypothetical protein VTN96DRAFT_8446 [Rasamsonia emersonii]